MSCRGHQSWDGTGRALSKHDWSNSELCMSLMSRLIYLERDVRQSWQYFIKPKRFTWPATNKDNTGWEDSLKWPVVCAWRKRWKYVVSICIRVLFDFLCWFSCSGIYLRYFYYLSVQANTFNLLFQKIENLPCIIWCSGCGDSIISVTCCLPSVDLTVAI